MLSAYLINELSSFATSTGAGVGAVKVGLYFLLVATPPGWVGLIVGGAIVGTAAFASTEVNEITKDKSGRIYDQIKEWLNNS